eukprot:4543867-Prymnesium_polylepis.1
MWPCQGVEQAAATGRRRASQRESRGGQQEGRGGGGRGRLGRAGLCVGSYQGGACYRPRVAVVGALGVDECDEDDVVLRGAARWCVVSMVSGVAEGVEGVAGGRARVA